MKIQQLFIVSFLFFQLTLTAQEWNGNYKCGEYGNLEIIMNSDNSFDFTFGYYSQNRIREYDGKANLTNDSIAVCRISNNCKVTFQLSANSQVNMEVSQDCADDQLYMRGTYKRIDAIGEEKVIEQTALEQWDGYYKNLRNGLELTMVVNKDGNLDFVFHSELDCRKIFDKGTAIYLDQLNSATFKDEHTNCYINIAFIDNQLHINGMNCDHGLFCIGFDGIYKKETDK